MKFLASNSPTINLFAQPPPPTVTQTTIRVFPVPFFIRISHKSSVFLFVCLFVLFCVSYAVFFIQIWCSFFLLLNAFLVEGQCCLVLSLTWNYWESLTFFVICFGICVIRVHACQFMLLSWWSCAVLIVHLKPTQVLSCIQYENIDLQGIIQIRSLVCLNFCFLFVYIKTMLGVSSQEDLGSWSSIAVFFTYCILFQIWKGSELN